MIEMVTMCQDCKECEATAYRLAGWLCDYCVQKRVVADVRWELAQYKPTGDVKAIAALERVLARQEQKLESMTPNRLTITDVSHV